MSGEGRKCSVSGCYRAYRARGYCSSHYARLTNGTPMDQPFPSDRASTPCSVGSCDLPAMLKSGMCRAHHDRKRRGSRNLDSPVRGYGATHPCRVPGCARPYSTRGFCSLHYQRMLSFNLSEDQVIEFETSDCDLCGRPPREGKRRHHIDHDHSCCPENGKSCGKCIRGVLCHGCNAGLGLFQDDPDILRRAISYLSVSDKLGMI